METSKLYEIIAGADEEEVLKALEDIDEEKDFSLRDSHGKTLFHIAVEKIKSVNVFKALLDKVDFTLKDDDGKTAIDMMMEDEDFPDDAENAFRDFVREKILHSKKEDLQSLVFKGWLDIALPDDDGSGEIDEEVREFVTKLPDQVNEIQQFHAAVKEDDLEKLKTLLQNKDLVTQPDRTGLPPLHKVVILGQTDILEYLAIKHDDVLNVTDNMGRTALHYAAGRRDGGHYYKLLTDAGATDDVKDLNGRTPTEIYEEPDLLPGEVVVDKLMAMLDRKPRLTKKKKGEIEEEEQAMDETDSKPPSPSAEEEEFNMRQKRNSTEVKPVKMYISPDKRINPPPTTVDGKYVAEHLGTALTVALAEIAERRPLDPVEYLAHWLYKYQESVNYNKKKQELLCQIREEEAAKKLELEMKEARRQEMMRLQEEERKKRQAEEEERKRREQEELQRKAREAALSQQPGLETVKEEAEEEVPKDGPHKDRNGQTELHKLAAQSNADLARLLYMGYSPAERDLNGKTARDIAEDSNRKENVEAIDNYVQKLIETEDYDTLQDILLAGYDKMDPVLDKFKEQSTLSEDAQKFIAEIPEFQERISAVFTAVQAEGVRDLQQALERKKLIQARDLQGRTPLHLAVLSGKKEAVEYIVQNFPEAIKCTDNADRTPLHYAKAMPLDDSAVILENNGADTQAKDVYDRVPEYYKENPNAITISADSSQQQQQEETESSQQHEQEGSQQQEVGQQQEQEEGQQQEQEVGQQQQESEDSQQQESTEYQQATVQQSVE